MNRHLDVVVMPAGVFFLEWSETADTVNRSTALLQEEVFKRFASDADSWLLFLGFCNTEVEFSPSLSYWQDFAARFARKLIRTPDLEVLRHRVEISIADDDLISVLASAPMMTGAEYLGKEVLKQAWIAMNRVFSREIQAFSGTVLEFINRYSPDVHLVGRIFFHLVENRSGDLPFAFLATYSTGLNKQGQSRHLPLQHALQEYGNDC